MSEYININDLLFIEDLIKKIDIGISLLEYEKYKDLLFKLENNSNSNDIDVILIEKIKLIIEKIKLKVNDKQPNTFIYDYYNEGFTDLYNIKCIEENNNDYYKCKQIYNSIRNDNLNYSKIIDIFSLASKDYLTSKVGLSENDIIDIKGIEEISIPIIKQENEVVNENRKEDLKVPRFNINQITKQNKNNLNIVKASKDKIDKDIENEIINDIFNNTKSMKNYAKNISDILMTDNKKLNKIENLQNKDQNKTKKELSSLKEFNYSMSIGFWKKLYMIAIVIITFIFTILIVKIFPKLNF